ncbi:obscurin-like isoform X2 [Anguilla anguilla]|uniref:obscurin-like isoform X2 n=1 Tax=Anguilla anguilla TaxID=7936 RepID=UPI0015A7EF21|nr:obscurin-like isoform X2 [Anguilla anguilla]
MKMHLFITLCLLVVQGLSSEVEVNELTSSCQTKEKILMMDCNYTVSNTSKALTCEYRQEDKVIGSTDPKVAVDPTFKNHANVTLLDGNVCRLLLMGFSEDTPKNYTCIITQGETANKTVVVDCMVQGLSSEVEVNELTSSCQTKEKILMMDCNYTVSNTSKALTCEYRQEDKVIGSTDPKVAVDPTFKNHANVTLLDGNVCRLLLMGFSEDTPKNYTCIITQGETANKTVVVDSMVQGLSSEVEVNELTSSCQTKEKILMMDCNYTVSNTSKALTCEYRQEDKVIGSTDPKVAVDPTFKSHANVSLLDGNVCRLLLTGFSGDKPKNYTCIITQGETANKTAVVDSMVQCLSSKVEVNELTSSCQTKEKILRMDCNYTVPDTSKALTCEYRQEDKVIGSTDPKVAVYPTFKNHANVTLLDGNVCRLLLTGFSGDKPKNYTCIITQGETANKTAVVDSMVQCLSSKVEVNELTSSCQTKEKILRMDCNYTVPDTSKALTCEYRQEDKVIGSTDPKVAVDPTFKNHANVSLLDGNVCRLLLTGFSEDTPKNYTCIITQGETANKTAVVDSMVQCLSSKVEVNELTSSCQTKEKILMMDCNYTVSNTSKALTCEYRQEDKVIGSTDPKVAVDPTFKSHANVSLLDGNVCRLLLTGFSGDKPKNYTCIITQGETANKTAVVDSMVQCLSSKVEVNELTSSCQTKEKILRMDCNYTVPDTSKALTCEYRQEDKVIGSTDPKVAVDPTFKNHANVTLLDGNVCRLLLTGFSEDMPKNYTCIITQGETANKTAVVDSMVQCLSSKVEVNELTSSCQTKEKILRMDCNYTVPDTSKALTCEYRQEDKVIGSTDPKVAVDPTFKNHANVTLLDGNVCRLLLTGFSGDKPKNYTCIITQGETANKTVVVDSMVQCLSSKVEVNELTSSCQTKEKILRMDCNYTVPDTSKALTCEYRQEGKVIGSTDPKVAVDPTFKNHANVSLLDGNVCRLLLTGFSEDMPKNYTCIITQGETANKTAVVDSMVQCLSSKVEVNELTSSCQTKEKILRMDCNYTVPDTSKALTCEYRQEDKVIGSTDPKVAVDPTFKNHANVSLLDGNVCRLLLTGFSEDTPKNYTCIITQGETANKTAVVDSMVQCLSSKVEVNELTSSCQTKEKILRMDCNYTVPDTSKALTCEYRQEDKVIGSTDPKVAVDPTFKNHANVSLLDGNVCRLLLTGFSEDTPKNYTCIITQGETANKTAVVDSMVQCLSSKVEVNELTSSCQTKEKILRMDCNYTVPDTSKALTCEYRQEDKVIGSTDPKVAVDPTFKNHANVTLLDGNVCRLLLTGFSGDKPKNYTCIITQGETANKTAVVDSMVQCLSSKVEVNELTSSCQTKEKILRMDCNYTVPDTSKAPTCEYRQEGKVIGSTDPKVAVESTFKNRANVFLLDGNVCRLLLTGFSGDKPKSYTCIITQGKTASKTVVVDGKMQCFSTQVEVKELASCKTKDKNLRMDCKYTVPNTSKALTCEYRQEGKVIGSTDPKAAVESTFKNRVSVTLLNGNVCRLRLTGFSENKPKNHTCIITQGTSARKSVVVNSKTLIPCSAISVLFQTSPAVLLTLLPVLLEIWHL